MSRSWVNQNLLSCFAAMCLFLLFLVQDFKYGLRLKAITTLYFSLWWRNEKTESTKKNLKLPEYEHVTPLMLAAVLRLILTCVISSWSQSAFGSMHSHSPAFSLILENRKQREETNLWSTSHSISGILLCVCVEWMCSILHCSPVGILATHAWWCLLQTLLNVLEFDHFVRKIVFITAVKVICCGKRPPPTHK